jgi:hypothetical protein
MYPERRSLSRRMQPASRGFCSVSPSLIFAKTSPPPLVHGNRHQTDRILLFLFSNYSLHFVHVTRAHAPRGTSSAPYNLRCFQRCRLASKASVTTHITLLKLTFPPFTSVEFLHRKPGNEHYNVSAITWHSRSGA